MVVVVGVSSGSGNKDGLDVVVVVVRRGGRDGGLLQLSLLTTVKVVVEIVY